MGAEGESHSLCCTEATNTITRDTGLGQDRDATVGPVCLDGLILLISSNMGSPRKLELYFDKNTLKIYELLFFKLVRTDTTLALSQKAEK